MKAKKLISTLLLLAVAGASVSTAAVAGCNTKDKDPGNNNTPTDPTHQATTYYVSPDGKDNAAGTEEDPLNIHKLLNTTGVAARDTLQAGDTVMVLPGDYEMKAGDRIIMLTSGTYDKPITIKNADPTKKATLKFYEMEFSSLNRGVQIYGDHFIWDGVDIAGAGDNGMYIGGSYNVVQNCEFYDNRDTGLQLGRSYSDYSNINQWPHYNLIKNCTSYNNYDNETYGENADGFAAKLTVGYGNVFDGCIAYRNSDDGWDLYAKTDSGNIGQVIMYNCVAYENGFIMEPQEKFNAKFPKFKPAYEEAVTNSYTTRDGDGNGFKLGGSIMEGEVLLENCLSFHNRMHGVTDNSNPGVITINGVTSYNNAASVNNNPTSQEFGYIMYDHTGADECANIDLARQTYSYNHVANTLSVSTSDNVNVNADAYRGTVENSKFWGPNTTYTVSGQEEYNTKTGDRGVAGTMIVDTEVFTKIPAMDMGLSTTAHFDYRNEDGSVNMHDILAQKDGASTYGSFVNKTKWEDYDHFDYVDLSSCENNDDAIATAVEKMLYVPIRTEACYQNFRAVTKMLKANISWASSDESVLKVTDIKGTSNSQHQDITIEVIRPADGDKKATLTATVTVGDVTKQKSFEINVKQNTYRIGEFVIDGLDKNDSMIVDKGANKFDYRVKAPEVVNDTSNSGAIIDSKYYTRDTYYKHGLVANPDFSKTPAEGGYEIMDSGFDARLAGIWQITETVTLKDSVVRGKSLDGSSLAPLVQQKSYRIFVAATDAQVDFAGVPTVTVNRDGFSIEGEVTSPTGTLYTKTVAKGAVAPTAQEIVESGVANTFRATSIFFNVDQANDEAYDIYYVMKNVDGVITTENPGKQTVEVSEITNKTQFQGMLQNNNSTTIYKLMNDIDFGGTLSTSSTAFVGVFNGMGHKLSNVTLTNTTDKEHKDIPGEGIFRLVRGGTIMNVTFENITISDAGPKTGIIALMYGGYASNIKVHNISVSSTQRVGGLIGQIIAEKTKPSTTYVDRIEVINDDDFIEVQNVYKQTTATVTADDFVKGNIKYYIINGEKYELAAAFDAEATYYEFVSGADALHFERGKFYEKVGENYVRCDDYKENTTFYQKKWTITGDRSGGVVGFIQAGGAEGHNIVYISDCYVYARIESGDYCGGILGRSDDRNAEDELHISNCYYNGDISCLKRAGGMLGGFTGTGITRIKSCLSLGTFYYAEPREIVDVAQKNCSGIMGNFAGNADIKVEDCLAQFEEYNSDYEVDTVIVDFLENKANNYFISTLEFDMTDVWEYVESETDTTKYAAPYIRLR
ncbi:MAG: right-handed parallel beta-helix repeat-containing protein [Clostridia bacterium]|nr:right-handed parallel beta-helix repeat-containing protein [Clostridia bacterium]